MFKHIKNKILFSYVVVLLSCFLIVLITTSLFIRKRYFAYVLEDLKDDARFFADELTARAIKDRDLEYLKKIVRKAEQSYGVDILDAQGNILADSKGRNAGGFEDLNWPEFKDIPAKGYGYVIRQEKDFSRTIYLALPIARNDKSAGFVRISAPVAYIEKTIAKLQIYVVSIFILAIAISFVISFILSRNISSPLVEMAEVAKEVSAGNLRKKVRVKERHDEIGILVSAFNNMIEHLRGIMEERKDILNNIAHELMTPITAIQGFAETLSDGKISDKKEIEDCLGVIQKESAYLEGLIEELRLLSKIDAMSMRYEFHPVDIAGIILDAEKSLSLKAKEKNIHVGNDFIKDLPWISADYKAIRQVFINLLDNAIKYSSSGKRILVSAALAGKLVKVIVKDEGIGIKPQDRGRIFERFYRVEDELRREKGLGLGLAIVKEILSSHNAVVEVESRLYQGSQFIVTFPPLRV